jgi:hypothetical protein
MGVRADLAAALAAAITPEIPAMQVYSHPEDITQLPAVVLVPGDPWCTPSTFGGNQSGTVSWAFTVSIVGHRSPVESTIDMMEQVRPLIEQAVGTLGGTWTGLGKPDTIELAGIMAMMADMDIAIRTGRQT